MLIQGDVKNLRPVQCFIRDDSLRGAADKYPCEQTSSANPFQPGGPLSEEGDTMVDLWRQGRLAMYCQQVTPTTPPRLSFSISTLSLHQKRNSIYNSIFWRLIYIQCQEGEANRHRQSHQQNVEGEIPSEMRRNVTLVQRREKFTSLCCIG